MCVLTDTVNTCSDEIGPPLKRRLSANRINIGSQPGWRPPPPPPAAVLCAGGLAPTAPPAEPRSATGAVADVPLSAESPPLAWLSATCLLFDGTSVDGSVLVRLTPVPALPAETMMGVRQKAQTVKLRQF